MPIAGRAGSEMSHTRSGARRDAPLPFEHILRSMMPQNESCYRLVDTKVGIRETFPTLEKALAALRAWIALQREAGEQVSELDGGEWKDSRVTVWISDPDAHIVRLTGGSDEAGAVSPARRHTPPST